MTDIEPLPDALALDEISISRIFNYALGGFYNFESDRLLARDLYNRYPFIVQAIWNSRMFLHRAIGWLIEQGIDQFIDLGGGIPDPANTHHIARTYRADARTIYIDRDPTTVLHGVAMLADDPLSAYIHADIKSPARVLELVRLNGLIDLQRPCALLAIGTLQAIPDNREAAAVLGAYKAAVAPGSYLVVGHWTGEGKSPDLIDLFNKLILERDLAWRLRDRAEIVPWFDDLTVAPPGIVRSARWLQEEFPILDAEIPGGDLMWSAVGRKE